MGRNGMGRNRYGPKWSWAEMTSDRLIYQNYSMLLNFFQFGMSKWTTNYMHQFMLIFLGLFIHVTAGNTLFINSF